MNREKYRFHHLGIPTTKIRKNEKYHSKLKFYHTGLEHSEFKIEWMRFDDDCPLPEIVQTVPHVAFEVDNLEQALQGRKVIIKPNSPSQGVRVAFILENQAPVELIQIEED